MSVVTNVILTASLAEEIDDEGAAPAVDRVNLWLLDQGFGRLRRVDGEAGGRKAMEAVVFLGAFNYLDLSEFLEMVAAAPWEDREGLAVFVRTQEAERFVCMIPEGTND